MGDFAHQTKMSAVDVFLQIAEGDQLFFMYTLAFMMGLGKGGVPGSSTSSVALNSLYAPDIPNGMNLAASQQVHPAQSQP